MTRSQHAARVLILTVLVGGLLAWRSGHTAVVFADGLRYINQARAIDAGAWGRGLIGSVDHPIYPLAVAAAHRMVADPGPAGWQGAAQLAAVLAGLLLVAPVYLIALELFGDRSAWLGTALTFAVPLTSQVAADGLSESTFLLFWSWGVWTALRFLRDGAFGWLPPTIAFAGLAYLTRPEGLLLPAALVATLAVVPLLRSTRLNWPRWWASVLFLTVGPLLVVGPFALSKGGLGTKPAIARLLGTAPPSPAGAVERQRPLEAGQSALKTAGLAVKAVAAALREAVTPPLLVLSLVGLVGLGRARAGSRAFLFTTIIAIAAMLALVRLYATGGYCTARHAMVVQFLLVPMAGFGLVDLFDQVAIPARWLGQGEGRLRAGPAVCLAVLGGLAAYLAPGLAAPINESFVGYREAGAYVAEHVGPDERVTDLTGWSLFYGERPGYTFANLIEAPGDPGSRWVVARAAHLRGPWPYCQKLRELVGGRPPVARFPEHPRPGQAIVFVFDRRGGAAAIGAEPTGDGLVR